MQKLVTVYIPTNFSLTPKDPVITREHLSLYLDDGWAVKSINTLVDLSEHTHTGCLVVLLEKQ